MFILISEREREKLWNIVIIDRREKKEKKKKAAWSFELIKKENH